MSQNKKIVLFIVVPLVAFVCLCCIVGVVVVPGLISNAVAVNPDKAHQVGAQIADYTLPRGYEEQMGMDLLMEQMVMLAPSNQRSGTTIGMTIMLMQFRTATYNREQMQQQMQQAFENQYRGGNLGWHTWGIER